MCNCDLRDYISPQKPQLTLCTSNGVLYHSGQHLKEVWKCVQLALYSLLSNPFWAHNGALLNNSKSSEKGQLQAWPERLNSDFMRMRRKQRVCVCVCSCALHSIEHSEDVPVSLHEVIRLPPLSRLHITEKYVSRSCHSAGNVLI